MRHLHRFLQLLRFVLLLGAGMVSIMLSNSAIAWSWDDPASWFSAEVDASVSSAKSEEKDVVATSVMLQPFLEIHSGPGRGYPVFYIAEKNEQIEILQQRTDWVKVKTEDGTSGWVTLDELATAINVANDAENAEPDASIHNLWGAGVMIGQLESATVMQLFGGYRFTENISAEVTVSQVLGEFSESNWLSVNLIHQPFPNWVVSPYFLLGGGKVYISPKATLAQEKKRKEDNVHYGFGARYDITNRYFLRLEYIDYTVFTDRDENENASEIKAGFGVHF